MKTKIKGKIFTAPEVQAIIAGNKKMFREVIKNANYDSPVHSYRDWENNGLYYPVVTLVDENGTQFTETQYSFDGIRCPYQVGQMIFVKEIWGTGSRPDPWGGYQGIEYKADKTMIDKGDALPCYQIDIDEVPAGVCLDDFSSSWQNARTMPQWASRITLQIKEIRAEKLQHISQEDCEKEGIGYTGGWNGEDYDDGEFFFGKLIETEDGMNWKNEMFEYPDLAFEKYWDSTHKKPKEKFEANPFVWVVDFKINK